MYTKTNLYLTVHLKAELTSNNMLTNVTKNQENRQLLRFTCFIIHVGPLCMEVADHA